MVGVSLFSCRCCFFGDDGETTCITITADLTRARACSREEKKDTKKSNTGSWSSTIETSRKKIPSLLFAQSSVASWPVVSHMPLGPWIEFCLFCWPNLDLPPQFAIRRHEEQHRQYGLLGKPFLGCCCFRTFVTSCQARKGFDMPAEIDLLLKKLSKNLFKPPHPPPFLLVLSPWFAYLTASLSLHGVKVTVYL